VAEQSGKRILVVDDARLIRSYYRAALEPDGYAIEEAMNGIEALEKLLMQPADLLIVDINMPMMDGLTFLKRLRRGDPSNATTPVLMTSTEAKPSDRNAAREAGANYYLIKPIAPDVLRLHVALMAGRDA
jgi:two-component system, chemotaxis family, chemotaxis protein CheY